MASHDTRGSTSSSSHQLGAESGSQGSSTQPTADGLASAPSMPILSSTVDGSSTSSGIIAGAGLPPFMSSAGIGSSSNSTSLAPVPTTTGTSAATTSSQSASAASAAATMAAAMFPEDMDDHDMGRLQAMLEARGFPPHLAGVLGPRMHHLIINRAMAPSATSKAQQLLQGLQATGDESRQLQAVIEMCQLLVMGNEDTLTGFPIRQVVPALIVLLKMEHNFDLMNHAARALTYMMEALPRSSSVIVDAIPTFLEKLQTIQCMDVAEQSLIALEMLSKKHNKSILHAKGVIACLTYLDFFSITAQRNALSITSNCCQNLLPEEFVFVTDALSTLSSRLVHEDKKSSESACLALSRLAESYKNDMNRLRDVAKPEVLENLQKILSANPPTVSSNTFVTVLHILVIMASHGSSVGPMLLRKEIGSTIRQLLVKARSHGNYIGPTTPIRRGQSLASTSSQAHDAFDRNNSTMISEQLGASSCSNDMLHCSTAASKSSSMRDIIESNKFIELTQRNPQELYEITSLIAELMPPLPADGIFAVDALLVRPGAYIRDPVLWQWQDDKGNWHTYGYNDCRLIEAAHVAGEEEATLSGSGKSFVLNLTSMHEIREDSGTARPIQRKLTSQLQQSSGISNSGVSDLSKSDSNADKIKEHDEHLRLTADLTRLLLPVLLEVYSTSAGPGVRHSCIQAFLRMIYHSSTELLLEVVSVSVVSSQIAGMLSSGDLKIIVGALQLSEILLQKMPEEFGVHFRREGVLHQVQKLTDPDNPISVSSYNESPLTSSSAWSTAASLATATNYSYSSSHPPLPGVQASSGGHSGRTWTVTGSSFTNMFPDQLRVSKRREDSSSTSPDTSGITTQTAVPLSSIQSSTTTTNSSSSHSSAAPLRLSDMLKRKRVSRRSSGRKGRYSTGSNVPESMPAIPSLSNANSSTSARDVPYPIPGMDATSTSMATSDSTDGTSLRYSVMNDSTNIAAAYDMSLKSSTSDLNPLGGNNSSGAGPSTPSRRSRLADRTSSLLSQLHPARWVRSSPNNPSGGSGMAEATSGSNSSQHGHSIAGMDSSSHHNYSGANLSHGLARASSSAKDTYSSSSSSAAMQSATHAVALLQKSVSSNPATMAHSREKAKRWVREQASRFLESYFKESLGSRHPALTILRRLSAQVDHLAKKPKDGEKSLRNILSILHENDISPFEVTQSLLVPSLLTYLTREVIEHHEEITRDSRVRTFAHVFLGCPKSADSDDTSPDPEAAVKFQKFVHKLNACCNHLEQFPIKMHDMTSASSGVKSAGSTLRFFKTHHLKCSLQRHPNCTSLKSWKGGLVKIDPLALVQAIERYLISRGYGHPQDKDSGGSDDEMSDDGTDDMLPSTTREGGSSRSGFGAFDGSTNHRLEFLIGDNVLPFNMTVYQAVQQFGSSPMFDMSEADSENRNHLASNVGMMYGSPGVWARIHTIYYRPVQDTTSSASSSTTMLASGKGNSKAESTSTPGGKKGKGAKQSKRKATDELWNEGNVPERVNPLHPFLVEKLPRMSPSTYATTLNSPPNGSDPSLDVLCLLRALHALNKYWGTLYTNGASMDMPGYYHPIILNSEFINSKLTAKVSRQLQDPIIIMTSNLPSWLKDVASVCPFLFPFETRQLLFYVTSFDRDRALLRLLDSVPELGATDAGQERVSPDLDRKKRVISRDNLMKQAEQVMNELASSRSLLEIQYENEVGTGLGPTLEFYTLVSKEIQRADLGLWKGDPVKITTEEDGNIEEDPDCIEYVHASTGLYPLPLARNTKSSHRNKIKSKFTFLGKFIAKAVLDNRMIDLPFSGPFFSWLLKSEQTLCTTRGDLHHIDPTMANTVSQLDNIVRKKRKLEEDPKLTPGERQERIKNLTMDGCPIEDLGLDFTLPGYPNIELRKGGKDINVTLDNLSQYVRLVSHWLLVEGVSTQMEAVKEGFESVFPVSTLQMFYPEELDQIFCGSSTSVDGMTRSSAYSRWDVLTLAEACKPDHGFTTDSGAIRILYEVMASYNREEQRQFLQFVTGCPRLPVGGFKALSPPLTIVKKSFDSQDVKPDDYLPSVMTCVNYLKLPDYSTKEIMREKLRIAAMEGQYCFHLS